MLKFEAMYRCLLVMVWVLLLLGRESKKLKVRKLKFVEFFDLMSAAKCEDHG